MRQTPSPQEKVKRETLSPTSIETSLCGRTPSHRAWTSPTIGVNSGGGGGGGGEIGRIHHQYIPPPPITTTPAGRPTVLEYDTASDAAGPNVNLNCAIPCSTSPLAEIRYPSEGSCRPASAFGTGLRKSSTSPIDQHHRPSSSMAVPQKQRNSYFDGCGAIVEERDSTTRDVVGRYRCGSLLGTGGFAQVFEFIDLSTGIQYAGKVIDKRNLPRNGSKAKIRLEVDIHSRMNHPNIVQFIKTFQDDFYYYIFLEQCSRKSLMELSKERRTFSCEEIQHIMIQITSAVEYLHSNLVIHRDLKLGNVMIDFQGNMKVGDFGFASELISTSDKKMTMCGTPNYIAPEILANEQNRQGYGLEVDIWSLGVLLYALAFGTPPFETRDINSTYSKIRRCEYSFPSVTTVSESCKDLIRWMLQSDPRRRPTAGEILRHSFLSLPQLPRIVPRSLVPLDGSRSPLVERRSPLWSSPIAASSPYAHGDDLARQRDVPKCASSKEGAGKELDARLRRGRCVTPKENDTFAVAGSRMPPASFTNVNNRLISSKPPPPSFIIQSSVYCNKYGYGFLSYQGGKLVPVVFLNDKTKLVYDADIDKVFYYGRSRMQAPPETGNRSPLLSEELATRGFRDDLVIFRNASMQLTHYHTEGSETADRIKAAAAKKLAITKFFLPFLEQDIRDRRMVPITCVFKDWISLWKRQLFAPTVEGNEWTEVVYVKDAVVETLYTLLGEYQELDMRFLAARMSNYSFQVSVRCNGCSNESLFVPKCGGLTGSQPDTPWGLDIILYSGFHAAMAFEYGESTFAFSFLDISRDYKPVDGGKMFLSSAFTASQARSITLPTVLLRGITEILHKVRCTDVVGCFFPINDLT